MFNHFTWCEISTFDLSEAKSFYENILPWSVKTESTRIQTCYRGETPSAGMVEMSDEVRCSEQPSAWLTYVHVDSLYDMVNLAVELGGRIEIHSTEFIREGEVTGKYALLSDPLGTELVLYEGRDLREGDGDAVADGAVLRSELHVDCVERVRKFYEKLLGWKFSRDPEGYGRYIVTDIKGCRVATLLELDRKVKGGANSWMVNFSVDDLGETLRNVRKFGGLVVIDLTTTGYGFSLIQDTQGAFFCLRQSGPAVSPE